VQTSANSAAPSEMELSRELRASESRLWRGEEERAEAFLPPREGRGHGAIRIILSISVCRLRMADRVGRAVKRPGSRK